MSLLCLPKMALSSVKIYRVQRLGKFLYYLLSAKNKKSLFPTQKQFQTFDCHPLLDQNPVDVRKILLEYLDEDLDKEEISAGESISQILKL